MGKKEIEIESKDNRRTFGAHLTSKEIFLEYIFPEIQDKLHNYVWVDLYAGEGNLILPILDQIPKQERISFFEKQIFLFDIQPDMVEKCINNAKIYGIPDELAQKNIKLRNNLESFPEFLREKGFPVYHITNPPYLYLGYIRKHKKTQEYLKYFENDNEGYQDLYQIAMINDLRNELDDLIYIIPANFLFGASVSNKFRLDFLKSYYISKIVIIETKIFEHTGTNICIGFFKRRNTPKLEIIEFEGIKIKKQNEVIKKKYKLDPKYKYRAGSEFDEFLEKYRASNPLKVNYYLMDKEVKENKGINEISVIDANKYEKNDYKRLKLRVNDKLNQKIKSNILFIQTVDKGSIDGRVGLNIVQEQLDVEGIYVSGNTYRTHPIQIFLEPEISIEDQHLLKDYFNFLLEAFREQLDSEFLTTYKYSKAQYTRKYLGLTQARALIETFPILSLEEGLKKDMNLIIQTEKFHEIIEFLKKK